MEPFFECQSVWRAESQPESHGVGRRRARALAIPGLLWLVLWVCMVCLSLRQAQSAVVYTATGSAAASAVVSMNHTFTNIVTIPDTTGICVVGIAFGDAAVLDRKLTTVTLGGATVTQIATRDSNDQNAGGAWLGRVFNSATGSGLKNLVISNNGANGDLDYEAGVICMSGQDITTPVGAAFTAVGNSTAPSVTVMDGATGDMIVDMLANGSTIGAVGAGQTSRWNINQNGSSAGGNGAQSTEPGAASVTMSWAVTTDWWAIIAVAVKQAAAGAPPLPASDAAVTFLAEVAAPVLLEWLDGDPVVGFFELERNTVLIQTLAGLPGTGGWKATQDSVPVFGAVNCYRVRQIDDTGGTALPSDYSNEVCVYVQ